MNLEDFKSVSIPLLNGGFTTVDIEDAPRALGYRWVAQQRNERNAAYARCNSHIDGKRVLLHRFLLGPKDDEEIDHRDGNGLNNRRSNLRVATRSQNGANRDAQSCNKLGIKGVRVRYGRYEARITVSQRHLHLGDYDTIEEATNAYRQAAIKHFGEFARWNNRTS